MVLKEKFNEWKEKREIKSAERREKNYKRMLQRAERKIEIEKVKAKLRNAEAKTKEAEARISNAVTQRLLNKNKVDKERVDINSKMGAYSLQPSLSSPIKSKTHKLKRTNNSKKQHKAKVKKDDFNILEPSGLI